ncbi:biopolymer transporter ExbD [Rhizobium sp. L1K21]|nr:biopolymer transporter ExbD [Rhizobium sp. L1K21]
MTSLIDVVFLLLLFFMLTSTFSRFAQTEITPPVQRGGTASQSPAVLAKPLSDGWLINGVAVSNEALTETMKTYKDKGAERVLLGVDSALDSQRLVEALESLRVMGLKVSISR